MIEEDINNSLLKKAENIMMIKTETEVVMIIMIRIEEEIITEREEVQIIEVINQIEIKIMETEIEIIKRKDLKDRKIINEKPYFLKFDLIYYCVSL